MKKCVFILVALLIVAGNGFMFPQIVQRDIQGQLMLKIISLDRNLSRFDTPVKIGVTSKSMLRVMNRFSKRTIKGRAFTAALITTLEDIAGYNIIYIDKNWKNNYKPACGIAVEKKILMFAGEAEAVEIGDAGVAFKMVLGKPKIVINLGIIKEQGTDFPAGLLQLSHVVGSL